MPRSNNETHNSEDEAVDIFSAESQANKPFLGVLINGLFGPNDCHFAVFAQVLLDVHRIMRAGLSCSEDFLDGQGALLTQKLSDYADPLQANEGQDMHSTCTVSLPFSIKQDFEDDVFQLDGRESTVLSLLRLEAFERIFSSLQKHRKVWNIQSDDATAAS